MTETRRDVAQQRLTCLTDGCSPVTANGPAPGADCVLNDGYEVFSPCDDGEGYCPAPDCKYYGPCVCVCHGGEKR